jgi:hypothetical protein
VLRGTVFCLEIYRTGVRSISLKLLCNLFENTSTVDSTSSIHIACFQLPYSYWFFFQVCKLLALLSDSAVKAVTSENSCIYQVCFFNGFVKYNYGRSIVMDNSISWYGPVMILFKLEVSNTDFGSYLYHGIGGAYDFLHLIVSS